MRNWNGCRPSLADVAPESAGRATQPIEKPAARPRHRQGRRIRTIHGISILVPRFDAYLEAGRLEAGGGGAVLERGAGGGEANGAGVDAAGSAGDDQGDRCGPPALDVLPHVPGDGNHGVSVERGGTPPPSQIAGHRSPKTTKLYVQRAREALEKSSCG